MAKRDITQQENPCMTDETKERNKHLKFNRREETLQAYSEREEEIRCLRYKEGWPLQKIADAYGLSKERIRQIVGNTGNMANEIWRQNFKEVASDPFLTNQELAEMFNVSPSTVSNHREGWHIAGGKSNLTTNTNYVYRIAQEMERMGLDVELMPLHHGHHILVAGKIKIAVRVSKGCIPPSQAGRLINPVYHFNLRNRIGKEPIDFYILITWATNDVFVVPADAIPDGQGDIGMVWPTARPEIGKYQKYHNMFSLIFDSLKE